MVASGMKSFHKGMADDDLPARSPAPANILEITAVRVDDATVSGCDAAPRNDQEYSSRSGEAAMAAGDDPTPSPIESNGGERP
jgi:hypothetical protein